MHDQEIVWHPVDRLQFSSTFDVEVCQAMATTSWLVLGHGIARFDFLILRVLKPLRDVFHEGMS